jgi:hypothetical protein
MNAPSKVTTQQILNFLNHNGIELKPSRKAPYINDGRTFEQRLLDAAKGFNTFLTYDSQEKEETVRLSHEADKAFYANPTGETREAMLEASATMRRALFA